MITPIEIVDHVLGRAVPKEEMEKAPRPGRMRFTGKTERNKKNGSYYNRFKNRKARVEWQNSRKSNREFPFETCNGKKNRQHHKKEHSASIKEHNQRQGRKQ